MTQERKDQYNQVYMKMAEDFASLSQATRSKVGCLIVSKEGQILSQGYNGMPSGMDNCCEHINENGEKVTCREVLHAETNAILKCAKSGIPVSGAILYVTLSPCFECAKVIAQAGISEVYYKEEYRNTDGLDLLKDLGIKVAQISNTSKYPDSPFIIPTIPSPNANSSAFKIQFESGPGLINVTLGNLYDNGWSATTLSETNFT